MHNPSTRYSIIVPVYNGAETIESCLYALLNQDYPKHLFEIIIINDGSTDETLSIASRYPVRIYSFSENRGRIEARMKGAIEADHSTLIFNDVRITPEREFISKINKYCYEPMIPNVIDYEGDLWGFSRFFYILRCRLYAPYYPLSKYQHDFFITRDNFDNVPKGTGCFVCNRELWISSQPYNSNRYTSDDTRILNSIVKKMPILRTIDPKVFYKQRIQLSSVLSHTFQRGPLFSDYYLKIRGKYFTLYLIILFIMLSSFLLFTIKPLATLIIITLTMLSLFLLCLFYLCRRWTDIIVITTCLPLVSLSFGLGILKWQFNIICSYFKKINNEN